MLLSELFSEDFQPERRGKYPRHAASFWAEQFERIVRESRGPKLKTRIVVRKADEDGER